MNFLEKQQQFVCIDCETTGLDPKNDRVIEVAAVIFTLEQDIEGFESLINPQMIIPEASIKIHHITDSMVVGKPLLPEVLPKLIKMIGRLPIVGHGVGFDIALLAEAAEKASIPHSLSFNKVIDTLRMARLYGESPINSLLQLGKHFNIEVEGTHRAMTDVMINVGVFKYLFKQYRTLNQLYAALDKPILMKKMPLGKHKGRLLKDLPLDYLLWAAKKEFDMDLLFSLRSEVNRRKKGNLFNQSANPFTTL
ncbi:MAG: DUF3820 family protein [Parachlamydiales bacterium]|jgi:DNA polymerase-3 subunit epsilon